MHFEDIMLSEINQSQKTTIAWFHLYEIPRIIKCIELASTTVVARGGEGGGRNGESVFSGDRVSGGDDGEVLERVVAMVARQSECI